MVWALFSAIGKNPCASLLLLPLKCEQKQKCDQQREIPSASVMANPKMRLPNWPAAADGSRRAAAQIISKNNTDTDARPTHADAGDAGANHFAACGSMMELLLV
jgi:hypothetical protein